MRLSDFIKICNCYEHGKEIVDALAVPATS